MTTVFPCFVLSLSTGSCRWLRTGTRQSRGHCNSLGAGHPGVTPGAGKDQGGGPEAGSKKKKREKREINRDIGTRIRQDRETDRKAGWLRQNHGEKVLSSLATCPWLIPEAAGMDPISARWMTVLGRQRPPDQAATATLPSAPPAAGSPVG